MSYATEGDIVTEIGRPALSPAEIAQWLVWIDRVERAIKRRFTREGYDLDAQVSLGRPTAEDVRDAIVVAVARKVENPTGITSVTRSTDDTSVTHRREGAAISGDPLALTDDEWSALLPTSSNHARVFSVMPS